MKTFATPFLCLLVAACGGSSPALTPLPSPAPSTSASAVTGPSTPMTSIPRQDTSLIPRKVLFGDPDRARVRLSHDGKWLSFLAPKDGVLNLWVAPALDHRNARPLTSETERSITRYQWAYDNKHIVFSKDKGGDENWYLIALDVESGAQRVLSPDKDVQANLLHASPQHPREVLVGLN
ncbi:MAG TPA: S9 family peptidase, partial [Polyangiaceae bacterium]|nr:S9 family peptidase [Polyangiaceae bacterium]